MSIKKTTVLLIALGFLIFLILFLIKVKGEMVDFEVCYEAGKRIWIGETLYRLADEHYQFKYPPSAALFYLPLNLFPLPMAKAIWYFIVLFSEIFLVAISLKLVNAGRAKFSLSILATLILAKFFLRELQLGQINAFITFLLLLAIQVVLSAENLSSSAKERGSGLFLGLAIALKPYSSIFIPYFLIKKKWHVLWTSLVFLAFAFFAPSLFYGLTGNFRVFQEWVSSLSHSTPGLLTTQDNISIIAFFMKWTGNGRISFICSTVVIFLLALSFLFLIWKGREISRSLLLESSILLILIPLISPLGWDYTLLSSVLGVVIVLKNFFIYSKFWRLVLIANFSIISLSLYDLLGKSLYATFMSASVITVNFLILIGYLAYLRMKAYC